MGNDTEVELARKRFRKKKWISSITMSIITFIVLRQTDLLKHIIYACVYVVGLLVYTQLIWFLLTMAALVVICMFITKSNKS